MAARRQDRAVGRKRQSVDLGLMADQAEYFLTGGDVPEADDFIVPGRRDVTAVGRECQTSELIGRGVNGQYGITGLVVPELDLPVFAGCGEQRASGRESDRVDISAVLECGPWLSSGHIPDPHRRVAGRGSQSV